MGNDVVSIEQAFRSSWRHFDPLRYEQFLCQVDEQDQLELLTRLIGTEIEYAYQPPAVAVSPVEHQEDDERIRPSLQILLARYPALNHRTDLVIRLSVLEYALRLQHDPLPPNPESYLGLCTHSQDHLLRLLQRTEDKLPIRRLNGGQLGGAKSNDSTIKDESDAPSISLEPLPNNLGCFLLIDLISRGGMGVVYSAIDLRSAAPVAVKVMRRDDSWSVFRFIEEFSWLSLVSHPNLVRLYDACAEGDLRYFSMELVEGKTVHEWFQRFRTKSRDPWPALKKVLAQAASAVQFLHHKGAIHCDIKCSNLMISGRRRAVLLDLGLAVRAGSRESGLGTLQYTAPEVVNSGNHSPASDWYSFGLMIYEILAEQFAPRSLNSAQTKSNEPFALDREDLKSQIAHADPDLVQLCLELVATAPDERPRGDEILKRLGGSSPLSFTNSLFMGRDREIRRLTKLHDDSRGDSRSRVIVVRGESGIGKTTLLRRWLQQIDPDQEFVVALRCYRQDQTPLRLLNGLAQALVQSLSELPTYLWRDSLETHVDQISQAFPQVRQLVEAGLNLNSRSAAAAPAVQAEGLGTRQLIRWIVDLNLVRRFLIIVDDAQWADETSLQWLAELFQRPDFLGTLIAVDESRAGHVQSLMMGELEATETHLESSHTKHATARLPIENLEISALPPEIARKLLAEWMQLAGLEMTPLVTQNIVARAHGSPFLLQELFLAYAHYAKRENVSEAEWLNVDSRKNLHRRFSLLPVQAENVLQFLAVAGQPMRFHQLQMASRILPDELLRTLNLLASQGWISSRFKNLESEIEISHERFRKAILDSMPTERLQRRHARLARMLSSEVPPPWSRMGDHYWSAEQYREAAACYLQAAYKALETGSFKEALIFLERANHQQADRNSKEEAEVLLLEADCLAGVGNASRAATLYERLCQSSPPGDTRLLYRCLAGEQWIRAGQLDNGLSYLEEVLAQKANLKVHQSVLSRLQTRYLFLRSVLLDSPKPYIEVEEQAAFGSLDKTLNRIGIPLTFLDNRLGPELVLQLKVHAVTAGSKSDQAIASLHYGLLLSFGKRAWLKPASKWLLFGNRLAKESSSPAARGLFHFCRFAVTAQQGRLRAAVKHANRSLRWYSRDARNLQWELHFLYWGMLGCYWNMMQLNLLRCACLEYRQSALERSDSMAQFFMHVFSAHWSDLVVDDVAEARRSLEVAANAISNQSFQSPRFFLWLSQISQELYEGRVESANSILSRDWYKLNQASVFRTHHYRWLALCLRLCCSLTLLRHSPVKQQVILRRAKRDVSHMLKLEHPAFVAHGKAFELVLQATQGVIAPASAWQSVIDELELLDHHLYANALRWHLGIHYSATDLKLESHLPHGPEILCQQARDRFTREGIVAPEKLMNFVIPLPTPSSSLPG